MTEGHLVLVSIFILGAILAWAMVVMARMMRMPIVIGPQGSTHVLDDLAKGQLNALIDRMRADIVTVRSELSTYQNELAKCREGEAQTASKLAEMDAKVMALRAEVEQVRKGKHD